jgi:hypothetical protein
MEQPNTTVEQNTVNPQEALVKAVADAVEADEALCLLQCAHGFLDGMFGHLKNESLQAILTLVAELRAKEEENYQKILQNLREMVVNNPLVLSPTEETPEEG